MLTLTRHFPTSARKTREVATEYDAVAKISGKFPGRGGGSFSHTPPTLKYTNKRLSGKWLKFLPLNNIYILDDHDKLLQIPTP